MSLPDNVKEEDGKLYQYGVICPGCNENLFSVHQHDFHYCGCGDTFVDGGLAYLRLGAKEMDKVTYCKRELERLDNGNFKLK